MKNFIAVFGVCLITLFCSFAAEWVNVQNKSGKFKLLFPSAPLESERSLNSSIGPLKMMVFMSGTNKFKSADIIHALIYTDYPASIVNSSLKHKALDEFFDGAIEEASKDMKGTILSKKVISINGYPGREAHVNYAGIQKAMAMRIYLVKNRSYLLEVAYKKGKEDKESIDKFFNSFELLPK